MSTTMPDTTTSTMTNDTNPLAYSAPEWATSYQDGGGSIEWHHQVELTAVEVDGAETLIVEAHAYDCIDADIDGVRVERGAPEIQITRQDTEHDHADEVPLRFLVADARQVAAAILKCCDVVEGKTAATA